jgi:hypothetical protein
MSVTSFFRGVNAVAGVTIKSGEEVIGARGCGGRDTLRHNAIARLLIEVFETLVISEVSFQFHNTPISAFVGQLIRYASSAS